MRSILFVIVTCLASSTLPRAASADEAPSARHLAARGRGLTIAGVIVTALGVGLVLAAPIILATADTNSSTCGSDMCGAFAILGAGMFAGLGSVALGVGIPLLAVGADDTRRAGRLGVTSMAARIETGGASLSFSGRF